MYIKVPHPRESYIYHIRSSKTTGSARLYCMLFYSRKTKREEAIILTYITIFIIKLYIRAKPTL